MEKRPFAAGRKWRRRRCDSSWRAEEAGSCFPGRTGLWGGAGPGPGRELKGRGASMGEGEWGRGALGRSGRWVGLRGWRAVVLSPGRGYDRGWCPPNPQRGPSCPRHEAAAGAGVREGLHSARLQQWHPLPVPDQVPRGAGEPGTQPGSPHLLWGQGDGGVRGREGPGTAGAWARAVPGGGW